MVVDKPTFSVLLKPVATNDQILDAWHNYQDLKTRLLDQDDFCNVSGKTYPKKSAFRKLALAFGISIEIINERRIELGQNFAYEVTAKATSPNGRYVTAFGSCHSDEKRGGKASDIRSIASTRSINRSVSDLLGGVIGISAEEMIGDTNEPQYEPFKPEVTKPNNSKEVFANLFKAHGPESEPEDLASEKQVFLIRKLVDQKISDESEQEFYLNGLENKSKFEASGLIKRLLGVSV